MYIRTGPDGKVTSSRLSLQHGSERCCTVAGSLHRSGCIGERAWSGLPMVKRLISRGRFLWSFSSLLCGHAFLSTVLVQLQSQKMALEKTKQVLRMP